MTNNKNNIVKISALLSLFTLLAFHFPFLRHAASQVESGFNGIAIIVSLVLMLIVANFFFYNLVLYLGRTIGKVIIALSLLGNAISLYFIRTYDVLIDATMMGNVFNTKYSEASGYFSFSAVMYVVLLCILPSILLFWKKLHPGTFKKFIRNTGISLGLILILAFANMTNWTWIDRNATELGSLLMPWSYTVNTFRYYNKVRERNREEIKLPDAIIAKGGKDVVVLIIGESARRDHFSLYGYERQTNPLLERDSVTALKGIAAATYTTAGVKAIIDYMPTDKLYEVLPNYMHRTGVDVEWRTTNWGEPPLHIDKYLTVKELSALYPDEDPEYDGILTEGLADRVRSSDKEKVLIILHTNTSHGPQYDKHCPEDYLTFQPLCTTVEMSKADPEELRNSYDNTILYTDYLIHSVISQLSSLSDWRSLVLYVSDHGESLGEGNLYMHGVPISIAPKEQVEIPFIVWTSDKSLIVKDMDVVTQYSPFHTALRFLNVSSPVYNQDLDIFE